MKNKIRVLCPEYVPLENKGEEAIIRGTMMCYSPILNVSITLIIIQKFIMNQMASMFTLGFVFPTGDQEFELGLSFKQIYSSICSLIRNGMNKFFPF